MITRITSHIADALARLASQFKEKPRIEALIRAFVSPMDEIEREIYNLNFYRWVRTATGVQLDGLGAIVGEDRRGRNDDAYRLAIITRIAINTSKGTAEDAITVFELLTNATVVHLYEYFPGVVEIYGNVNFEFTLEGNGPDAFAFEGGLDGLGFGDVFDPNVGGRFARLVVHNVNALYVLMDSVLAAGVRLDRLGYWSDPPFGFDGDPAARGFGNVFDGTVGGGFARIVPRT